MGGSKDRSRSLGGDKNGSRHLDAYASWQKKAGKESMFRSYIYKQNTYSTAGGRTTTRGTVLAPGSGTCTSRFNGLLIDSILDGSGWSARAPN
jgi:hypothetical protein